MSTMNMSRFSEWERALPAPDELTPISQSLIPPELACAFNIPRITTSTITAAIAGANGVTAASTANPPSESPLLGMRNALLPTLVGDQNSEAPPPVLGTAKESNNPSDPGALHRQQNLELHSRKGEETAATIRLSSSPNGCSLGSQYGISPVSNGLSQYMASSWPASSAAEAGVGFEDNSIACGESQVQAGNATKIDPNEEVDSVSVVDSHQSTSSMAVLGGEEQSARTLKKPRLVWTPQLHGRFVEAVGQLGIRNAVPKTIMQLMNVEGLTRENVASHLQKYRLYLKRLQQGLPNEGPSASDHLFASTPVPPGLTSSSHYLVSHHPHQQDHAFGANVSTVLSHNIGATTISPPALPFSGFTSHPVFPNAPRPAPVSVPVPMPPRDSFPRPPSSPSRRVLTLFPTGGS